MTYYVISAWHASDKILPYAWLLIMIFELPAPLSPRIYIYTYMHIDTQKKGPHQTNFYTIFHLIKCLRVLNFRGKAIVWNTKQNTWNINICPNKVTLIFFLMALRDHLKCYSHICELLWWNKSQDRCFSFLYIIPWPIYTPYPMHWTRQTIRASSITKHRDYW